MSKKMNIKNVFDIPLNLPCKSKKTLMNPKDFRIFRSKMLSQYQSLVSCYLQNAYSGPACLPCQSSYLQIFIVILSLYVF